MAIHYQHFLPDYYSRMNISFPSESKEAILSLSFCSRASGVFTEEHAQLLAELRPLFYRIMGNFLPERYTPNTEAYKSACDDVALISQCSGMKNVLRDIESVAPTNATVLIQGESGVGKEVVARAIHKLSTFAKGPFVAINCGALTETLIDSLLFGHEKGAYTGAEKGRKGFFEQAQNGTLFLDEIGDMPLVAQTRLLRVLEMRQLKRIGGEKNINLNFRILAATHRNLFELTRSGAFRADLWYRLSLFLLKIPPLRQRREDIRVLARYFCAIGPKRLGLSGTYHVSTQVINSMLTARWPGNVRQLQHTIERAIIGARKLGIKEIAFTPDEDEILCSSLKNEKQESTSPACEEQINAINALRQCKGRISGCFGAATLLGINSNTFRSRLRKMGINPKDYRA